MFEPESSEPFLSIVVPAYNEAARIGPTLDRLRSYAQSSPYSVELIMVDDGSTDETLSVIREAAARLPGLRVLCNDRNRGKGFSVRRGVLAARGRFVLFTDADLSAPIEETDKLLAALTSEGADAAVGSRALARELIGVRQPWFRVLAGRVFNIVARVLTGLAIRDTQCGLKLFRRRSTRRAFRMQTVCGFGFDPELLFLIRRLGGRLVEVPVRWNNDRATKVRFLQDSTRMFLDLVAIRWRALTGKYPLDQPEDRVSPASVPASALKSALPGRPRTGP
jgi:dolichyl-phosphate beta-glucosyltransferase